MKSKTYKIWCLGAVVALLAFGQAAEAAAKKVLVVTVTKGFRHSSIPTAEKVLEELAKSSGAFTVDYARTDEELAAKTSEEALAKYDGVIFANTTGTLPLPDKEVFMDWIRSGKGFMGMHSATDTFHGYSPFIEMIGGEFAGHGPQATVECLNEDPDHPATAHFGDSYVVHDEIYLLKNFHRERVHGLLTLDKHPNKGYPGDFPIAWSKKFGDGRVFYTSLGHREDVWEAEPYQKHILGGIKWALGLVDGDVTPQNKEAKLSQEEKEAGFKPLFNGRDLSGWKLRRADGRKSWSAQNGMLVNDVSEGHGTDLVTEEKFRDFVIRCEYMVPEGSNSGLYLRGRHEIQILDDYKAKEPKAGGNGGIYSVKAPDKHVSKPAGEWQKLEAKIEGNEITVWLNGVKIHDEVEVNRATGGELDSNLDEPGPIMLQGDHGAIAVRNIRVKPLK